MTAQTSYSINQRIALPGMLADLHNHDIISRSIEGVAGVNFGVAVSRGTDKDKQAIIGGTDFLGITVRSLEREGAVNTGEVKFSEKETAAILRDGYIFLTCPTGCNPGDAANYNETTGIIDSGTAVGTSETTIDDATWDTTAAAGELAILRIAGINTTAGV